MIGEIALKNFKGHKKSKVNVGKITILIGPNGTGKSSILQALLAIRQSLDSSSLVLSGNLVNLGSFNDVINKDSEDGQLEIGISILKKDYSKHSYDESISFSCNSCWKNTLVGYDAVIKGFIKEPIKAKYSTQPVHRSITPTKISLPVFDQQHDFITLGFSENFSMPIGISGSSMSPNVDDTEQLRKTFIEFRDDFNNLLKEFKNEIQQVFYVPAIRGIESPFYNLGDNYLLDMPVLNNAQLATTFAYADEHAKEMIETWSEKIIGSEISVKIIPKKRIAIESFRGHGIPIIGDGFGANQLVHLLLILAITPNNSLIAIEEPEIHLHPRAQSKLVDILLEVTNSTNQQLLFTTHSEYMLYGFLKAIKSGQLSKEDLSIYYFEDPHKEPKYLEIDEGGDIYDWGRGFFS